MFGAALQEILRPQIAADKASKNAAVLASIMAGKEAWLQTTRSPLAWGTWVGATASYSTYTQKVIVVWGFDPYSEYLEVDPKEFQSAFISGSEFRLPQNS